MSEEGIADIPESYFEYRGEFRTAIFDAWRLPNPFVKALFEILKSQNVSLGDFSFAKTPSNLREVQLTVNVTSVRAILKVGIDTVTFVALNPDWADAPALIQLFEVILKKILEVGNTTLHTQEIALAMHVKPGKLSFSGRMAELVNKEALGPAEIYGVSVYRSDSTLVIDKSQRYLNSIFIRLNRRFSGEVSFPDIAASLYTDENQALKLLGLQELIEGQ